MQMNPSPPWKRRRTPTETGKKVKKQAIANEQTNRLRNTQNHGFANNYWLSTRLLQHNFYNFLYIASNVIYNNNNNNVNSPCILCSWLSTHLIHPPAQKQTSRWVECCISGFHCQALLTQLKGRIICVWIGSANKCFPFVTVYYVFI